MYLSKALLLPLLGIGLAQAWAPGESSTQPNIVYILADDLGKAETVQLKLNTKYFFRSGFNDVSWKNSDVITPNMEALRNDGVLLDQFYAQPACSLVPFFLQVSL